MLCSTKSLLMSIDSNLLEIIVCPECKGPLDHERQQRQLTCFSCKLAYPINEQGVPLLISDEAYSTHPRTVEPTAPPR